VIVSPQDFARLQRIEGANAVADSEPLSSTATT
jgi:hypothetical protein